MKIDRAKAHLRDLEGQIKAFHGRKPYSVFVDQNSEPGKVHFRIKVSECVPAHWSAIIGDIIHNLRSSLDLLATALVAANGGSTKHTYFPFAKNPADFEPKVLRERMKGASPKAITFAKRLKPYPGGNEALWKLHALDLLDKHQAIIPVGAAHTGLNPDFAHVIPPIDTLSPKIRDMDETMRRFLKERPIFLNVRGSKGWFPMQDNTILLTLPAPKAGQPKPNPQFTFEIAFGEGQIIDGEPVVETLQSFIKLAERIAKIAQRHFF